MILVSIIPRYPKTHLRLISSTTGLLMPKEIRMLPQMKVVEVEVAMLSAQDSTSRCVTRAESW